MLLPKRAPNFGQGEIRQLRYAINYAVRRNHGKAVFGGALRRWGFSPGLVNP